MRHNGLTLDEVLHLHTLGFNLIPLSQWKAKAAALPWKQWHEARQTEAEISAYYNRFGYDSWGILTGAQSGIVAIDADDAEAVAWVETHLPHTPVTTTTSRGKHYLYRHPLSEAIGNAAGLAGLKLDRRGDGGLIVAPGSRKAITGHVYKWGEPWTVDLLATAPQYDPKWFPEEAEKKVLSKVYTTEHSDAIRDPSLPLMQTRERAAQDYLDALPSCKKGDGGKYCLAVASCLLWEFALSAEIATNLLYDWGQATTRDGMPEPWTWKEITHKIDDASKFVAEDVVGGKVRHLRDDDSRLSEIIKGVDVPAAPTAEQPAQQPAVQPAKYRGFFVRDLREMKPVDWLIEQHLTERGVLTLFGQSGSYKSFVAIDMALSVAHGVPFLGQHPTKKGKVAYLCSEGFPLLNKRCRAWYEARGLDDAEDFAAFDCAVNLADQRQRAELWESFERGLGQRPDLVVIDTLSKNYGGLNTNDGDSMQSWYDAVLSWRVSCVVVHHAGWSSDRERGSSNVRDNSTATFRCVKNEGGKISCEVTCLKQKDHAEIDQYRLDGTLYGQGDDASIAFTIDDRSLSDGELLASKFPPEEAKAMSLKAVHSLYNIWFGEQKWRTYKTIQNKLTQAHKDGYLAVSRESPKGANAEKLYYRLTP